MNSNSLITIIFFFSNFLAAAEEKYDFKLTDMDCKTMAGRLTEKEIKASDEPTKSITECSAFREMVSCITKKKQTGVPYHKENYEVVFDSPEMSRISTEQGNVTYVIDKKSKTFVHSQFMYVREMGILLSKSCIGSYENKK